MFKYASAAVLAAALFLAGCPGTIDKAELAVDETLSSETAQHSYDRACKAVALAEITFQGLLASGLLKIDDAGMAIYDKAVAVVDPLCVKPYPTDTKAAIAKIMSTVSEIGRLSIPYESAEDGT